MKFRCIVTYTSNRSRTPANWHTMAAGPDALTAAARAVIALRKVQRRPVHIVGFYVHETSPGEAVKPTAGRKSPPRKRTSPPRRKAAASRR